MSKGTILIVDDEEDLCEILQFNLENEGYSVDVAFSAEEALTLDIGKYQLLLLDVMMGEMSGFKLANRLRKDKKFSVPIIFLTAKTTENDLLTGFSLGADDYIKKPFSVKEVIARAKAVILRSQITDVSDFEEESTGGIIRFNTLVIDEESKLVEVDGADIKLTKKEYEILILLSSKPGKVYSRDEILDRIWRDESYVITRTVDVNITRLRKKIGGYGQCIVTRQGYGYCFEHSLK